MPFIDRRAANKQPVVASCRSAEAFRMAWADGLHPAPRERPTCGMSAQGAAGPPASSSPLGKTRVPDSCIAPSAACGVFHGWVVILIA
jgi:hypothetical protein